MKNIEELKCELQFTAFCMKLTMGSRDGSKTPSTYEYKIIARPGKDFGAGTQNTHHACTIRQTTWQISQAHLRGCVNPRHLGASGLHPKGHGPRLWDGVVHVHVVGKLNLCSTVLIVFY